MDMDPGACCPLGATGRLPDGRSRGTYGLVFGAGARASGARTRSASWGRNVVVVHGVFSECSRVESAPKHTGGQGQPPPPRAVIFDSALLHATDTFPRIISVPEGSAVCCATAESTSRTLLCGGARDASAARCGYQHLLIKVDQGHQTLHAAKATQNKGGIIAAADVRCGMCPWWVCTTYTTYCEPHHYIYRSLRRSTALQ